MAFKMKGFPYRSGFKHADTGHSEEDHQHIEAETKSTTTSEGEIKSKGLASFDVDKELKYINRMMQHGGNAKNPYYTERKAQLEASLAGEGTLEGYRRATP